MGRYNICFLFACYNPKIGVWNKIFHTHTSLHGVFLILVVRSPQRARKAAMLTYKTRETLIFFGLWEEAGKQEVAILRQFDKWGFFFLLLQQLSAALFTPGIFVNGYQFGSGGGGGINSPSQLGNICIHLASTELC